jgi:1-acyl-sn-glycerol-3-phosphate acyltransferase
LKIPLALLRIEGGYGVEPRWGNKTRRGRIDAYVSRVVSVEEIRAMSDEELFSLIEKELYVNDCASGKRFRSKKRAECMERAFYVCPECGISSFRSRGADIVCQKCHKTITLGEDLSLTSDGAPLPFADTATWYDYQNEYLLSHDTSVLTETPLHEDVVDLLEIIPYKCKRLLAKKVKISLFGDRYEIETEEGVKVFSFEDIKSVTCLGKKKVNFSVQETIYQIKGDLRFPLLEYMNIYFNYQSIKGGHHDRFLGI